MVVKEFSHLLQGNFLRVCRAKAGRTFVEWKNEVRPLISAACSDLAVLFSHMADVDFPVLVAFVAEHTLPP